MSEAIDISHSRACLGMITTAVTIGVSMFIALGMIPLALMLGRRRPDAAE